MPELAYLSIIDNSRNSELIAKCMIWSAARGDTAFTVPSFGRFMRRVMPGDEWRE